MSIGKTTPALLYYMGSCQSAFHVGTMNEVPISDPQKLFVLLYWSPLAMKSGSGSVNKIFFVLCFQVPLIKNWCCKCIDHIGHTCISVLQIGLYSEWMQRFEGRQSCINGRDLGISGSNVYCAKTETLIPYKPTPQQLRAALLVSGNCSQTYVSSRFYVVLLAKYKLCFHNLQGENFHWKFNFAIR